MRVLFVVPPDEDYIAASAHESLDKKREVRPKLGILYVASYLKSKRPDISIKVLDCPAIQVGFKDLPGLIELFNPDIVAITAVTFTIIDAIRVADAAKKINPRITIVIGGVHSTYYPKETLNFRSVDILILGEGEITFFDLVQSLENGSSLDCVEGIAYKENEKVRINKKRKEIADLDSLPFPDYDLVGIKNYSHILGDSAITASIQTSRGCPFGCIFCDNRRTNFRARSAQSVIREIEGIYKKGIHSFFFIDDNFIINKKRAIEICMGIVDRKMNIDYKISARIDLLDEELMIALKQSGCSRVSMGVETIQQRHLDFLNKGITIEQTKNTLSLARKNGLNVFAYMMIGLPDQTEQEMYDYIKFLRRAKVSYASFSVCSPYPMTPLYTNLLENGTFKSDFWREFAEKLNTDFEMPTCSKKYSSKHLRKIQKDLTFRFYFTPAFILKTLGKINSFSKLKVIMKLFFNLSIKKNN